MYTNLWLVTDKPYRVYQKGSLTHGSVILTEQYIVRKKTLNQKSRDSHEIRTACDYSKGFWVSPVRSDWNVNLQETDVELESYSTE